ncbi:MAG: hypothetical protein ACXW15_08845 [Acidimicrobiia bacterium]
MPYVFEVEVDGDRIFAKMATRRHAEYEDIAGPIRTRYFGSGVGS